MIFWHVGGTVLAFRYVFRDPNVDLRFLALGAILPDLIDKPIGTILFADTFESGQIFGHSLLFSSMLMVMVLLFTGRGVRRRRLMALAIGSLFHLVLDGMWTVKETFLWPAFGWGFPPGPEAYWGSLLERLAANPWILMQEALGIIYLVYLWRKADLGKAERRSELLTVGTIHA
ncbi:MAG: metal-dependent hydrolase [Acidimicrobiia bacterium]|nr:metal-dependent hydrolase [Acidimicrobiia bacterium]